MDMRTLPALLILLLSPLVHAEVYKCLDASGAVTYTNDRTLGRGCKQLSEDLPVSSVPAPPRRSPATQTPGSPSNFPRVAPEAQRARDDTRRQVLEKELATEEAALSDAQKALAEQENLHQGADRRLPVVQNRIQAHKDKIELHQRNVEALKKEIGNLK